MMMMMMYKWQITRLSLNIIKNNSQMFRFDLFIHKKPQTFFMAQLVEEESVDFNTRSSTTTRCTTLCVININVSTVSCGQWRQQGARQWVAQQRHLGELDSTCLSSNWRGREGLLNFLHLKLLLSRSNLTDPDGSAGDAVNLTLDFRIFKYCVNTLPIFHEKIQENADITSFYYNWKIKIQRL